MPQDPKNPFDGVTQEHEAHPGLTESTGIKKRTDKGKDATDKMFDTRGGNKDAQK